jgi:tetratricopeptide (TPR) repeat protein
MLWEEKRRAEAEREWRYAIALYPSYFGVYQELAHKYREAHVCPAAIPLYIKALSVESALPFSRVGLVACYLEMANFTKARSEARTAIADSLYRPAFEFMICKADSALVSLDSIDATIRWAPLSQQRRWRAEGVLAPVKDPKRDLRHKPQNARTPALLWLDSLGPVTSKRCKSLLHSD